MNSCFEGLEGRKGLNRVREFIPKAGKMRNERVKVSRGDANDLKCLGFHSVKLRKVEGRSTSAGESSTPSGCG